MPWLFRELKQMGRSEKALWTFLMLAFFLLELRTLYLDRSEHDRDQAFARCEELKSFQDIANALKLSISQAQSEYGSTISHVDDVLTTTRGVASTAKSNLDQISGKDSYPCIVPQSHAVVDGKIPIVFYNRGKNNLTGVEVQILSPHAFTQNIGEFYKPSIELGTVNPIWSKPIPGGISPELDTAGLAGYTFFIWTQNGFYSEVIEFRKGKYDLPWAYRYWLYKRRVFDHAEGRFPKGAQASILMKGCQTPQWSDDLGDGKPPTKPPV
ncbi:MAG: hypothetical protein ABI197_04285 [Granulicella sp.]